MALMWAAMLVGCAPRSGWLPTLTLAGAVTAIPTLEATPDDVVGRLIAVRVDSAPAIDGQVEEAWAAALPLRVPLTYGPERADPVLDLELRALHTDGAVSFLAQWPGEAPPYPADEVLNKLTLHWRIPELAAQNLDCSVVCHTAHADGSGRFVYANSETIPQGGSESLSAAGGWKAGIWTLEWGRPLDSDNPFDLDLSDLDQIYSFRVKVFEHVAGRADPVSGRHLLVFQP